MTSRAIRGATTVENNTEEEIAKASSELFDIIIEKNEISYENISHMVISATDDINSAYPAKYIRTKEGVQNVPVLCLSEMDVKNSLKMCIRILMVINTDKAQNEIKHIYLKGAKVLREDLLED